MTVAKSQSYKNLRQSPQLSFYSTMQLPLILPFVRSLPKAPKSTRSKFLRS